MKQGRASTSSVVPKREPKSHAVSVCEVSEIGVQQVHYYESEELYKGRGYEAPMAGSTTHHCGSQGKHR